MTASRAGSLSLRHNLTPEGLSNPYAMYAEMRCAQAEGVDVGRVVLSHKDVLAVLGDRSMSADRVDAICRVLEPDVRRDVALVEDTIRRIVTFRDPPDHTRLRRLLQSSFTPAVLARQRHVVESAAERALAPLAGCNEADLFGEVLFPFPAMVIAGILGVSHEDRPRFVRWAMQLVFFVGSGRLDEPLARETQAAFSEMRTFFAGLIARRRADPGDDLLTAMLNATDTEGGATLDEDEVIANALFLMTAGHETAANQISNGVISLLRHPDQLALLRERPELIEPGCEEILRYEPAVQMTARLATDPDITHIAGQHLASGDTMIVVLAAANRDPEHFEGPDRFDITRPTGRHVAFAHGPHWCLGGNLARQEMAAMLPRIFERCPGLKFAEERIDWQQTLSFRGPTRLPVRW